MANPKFQISTLCLFITMMLTDLSPTSSICCSVLMLATSLIWVTFQHTQISLRVSELNVSRVASFSRLDFYQIRVFFLFFWKSVFLTLFRPQPKSNCVSFFPSSIGVHRFIIGTCLFQSHRDFQSNLNSSNLRSGDQIRIWDPGVNGGSTIVYLMELWLLQFSFCWIAISRLHVGLVKYWEKYLLGFAQIWWLENVLAMFRRKSVDKRGSNTWNAMEILFVLMLKSVTKSKYFGKTMVRKFWCHWVFISELDRDISVFIIRFVKRSFSHKLLHAKRSKERSNMKLDNNGSSGRLASKATLWKASSNSLLLYLS